MKILGIDPSLTSCGVAVIQPSGTYTAVNKTTGKRADPIAVIDTRLGAITGFVLDHAAGAALAVIEGPSLGSHGGSPWDRAGLWWRIVHRLHAADIPVAVAPPTVVKKWATGIGGGPNASKAAVAVAVARLWPDVDADVDDE